MLNSKKTEILLGILLIIFITGFFVVQNPSSVTQLINAKAVQQNIALSVTITGSAEESINATTGTVIPTDSMIKQTIPKIEGLPLESNIKLRVYTADTTPIGFTSPSSTQVTTIFNYINITLNTTLTGTAIIHFNISQSDLGSIDPDDIRLYIYTTSWNELTTTVISGTADPASFSAETDSFSPFLIGEKGAGGVVITPPLSGPISSGGISLPTEVEKVSKPKPIIKLPELIKKVVEKVKQIPEILQYEVSYKFLYITATFIILFVILLEIIYYLKVHKK